MGYIAYKGARFIIEWYVDRQGGKPAEEYLQSLNAGDLKKAFYLFKMMGDRGIIQNKEKFRNEGDDIYAFKPQPHRFLSFFVKGKKIIVTNAFRKKSNKMPPEEKCKAKKSQRDYFSRVEKGEYYE